MKTKHTPGPWTVERFPAKPPYQIAPKEGIYVVCGFQHERIYSQPLEMREANAALIAAAPELLQALEAFMDGQFRPSCQKGIVNQCACPACNADRGRAAIKKARGE